MVVFVTWCSHEMLRVGRKDFKGEGEPSILFLKATSHQNRHVFLMHRSASCQDDLRGNLRSCGLNHCKAHCLSQRSPQVSRCQYGCKIHCLSKVELGYLSTAVSSEGKILRPDGGALESEEMGVFSTKLLLLLLLPLLTFLHTEPEIVWLSQIKSLWWR